MPFLGQFRRPLPHGTGLRLRFLNLALDRFLRRRWPVVWAFGLLLGFQVGLASGAVSWAAVAGSPEWLARAAVGSVLLLAMPRIPAAPVLAVMALLALGSGSGFGDRIRQAGRRKSDPPWVHIPAEHWRGKAVVKVTGWAAVRDKGRVQFPAVLVEPGEEEECAGEPPESGQGVLLTAEGSAPPPGSVLAVRVDLRPPGRRALPGGFSDDRYLRGKGLDRRGRVEERHRLSTGRRPLQRGLARLSRLRARILDALDARLPAPEAALAGAVLLGRKSPLARSGSEPFVDLGLAHLFALSGLHVGILMGIVLLVPTLLGAGTTAKAAGLGLVLCIYGLLTGAPGSVVRAAGLLSLGMTGAVWGRRSDPLWHLGVLFLVLSAGRPRQLLDVGCTLSYLAAGGILAMGPALQDLQKKIARPANWAAVGLGVSLSAQWFTLPVVAESFGRINAWSLVANLVVVPYFALVVWLTVMVLLTGWWPWAASSLSALATLAWRALLIAVHPVGLRARSGLVPLMPPGASGWILWFVGTVGILAVAQGLRKRWLRPRTGAILMAGILTGVLAVFARQGRDLSPRRAPLAWQVDVDQGDCAVLAFPDHWRCIIDTAGRWGFGPGSTALWDRTLGPYLWRQGIEAVDLVVLSHGHLDHTGGAAAIADELDVGAWLCGGRAKAPPRQRTVPVREDSLLHRWGVWDLVLLQGPDPADEDLSENDHSLLLALRRERQVVMLWGGDQERAAEGRFIAARPDFPGTQVWKAGHHGSDTSGSCAFVDRIRPRLCLISCGAGNRYLHPRHGPYVTAGDTVPTVRTDCSGSIRLSWNERGGLVWRTMYGGSGSLPPP